MTSNEQYWLAGLLEGEGSFLHGPPSKPNCPAVVLQMTDKDVVKRAAALMGTTNIVSPRKQAAHHKPSYLCKVTGRKAIGLMKTLLPLLGERRTRRVKEILDCYEPAGREVHLQRVRKLTDADVRKCRRRHAAGDSFATLAEKFGVARTAVVYAVKRITYKHVK